MINKRIIDLSHELQTGMPTYSGDRPKPQITTVGNIKGTGITMSSIRLGSHYGTHIDAPRHFFPEGKMLLDFQVDRFFGKAICVRKTRRKSDRINLSKQEVDLINIQQPDWLLIYTGFDKCWEKEDYFLAHPYLSDTMVKILVNKNIGDCDGIIRKEKVGFILEDFMDSEYESATVEVLSSLRERDVLRRRCRGVAERLFSLDSGVERYLKIYDSLV